MRRPPTPAAACRSTPRRRGTSLIELMVLISLLAVVAGSSCVLIARMMQSNRHQADTLVQRRTMHLWQSQFQQDGRDAQAAHLNNASPISPGIEFQLPEGRVIAYQVGEQGLERHVDGKLTARWACGPGTWSFSIPENARIARAEFHPSSPQSLQGSDSQSSNQTHPPHGADLPIRVDVALATGIYHLHTAGAP